MYGSKKHTDFSSFLTFRETPSRISTALNRKNSCFSNKHITGFVPGCISLIYYYETLVTMNLKGGCAMKKRIFLLSYYLSLSAGGCTCNSC